MKAMRLHAVGQPLRFEEVPLAAPGPNPVRIAVEACGVCRTDLRLIDGEEFMRLAAQRGLGATAQSFPPSEANSALQSLRHGAVQGTAVLTIVRSSRGFSPIDKVAA